MDIFVIHKGKDAAAARSFLTYASRLAGIKTNPILLANSFGESWKRRAEDGIYKSEAVFVYDAASCLSSENAEWEKSIAHALGRPVIEHELDTPEAEIADRLKAVYHFEEEFQSCFQKDYPKSSQSLELYKIMVETSEELVRRRQITNGFFTTVIGGLVAACGFVLKEGIISGNDIRYLLIPALVGILICRSWGNLIRNYGHLNRAKFKVINRMEEGLPARIFSAEWVALGKGLRPEKYRSFTDTEQSVPKLFSAFLIVICLYVLVVADWSDLLSAVKSMICRLMLLLKAPIS